VRFDFIRQSRSPGSQSLACRVLKVSRAGLYAVARRVPCSRQQRQEKLRAQIRGSFEQSRGTYGSWRITAELRAGGTRVCRNTVARLMCEMGLKSGVQRRFVPRTTDAHHDHPIAANLLDRQFSATAPNQKWVADITYVPTAQGFLYLAAVLDLYSRRIVGWNMADHLQSDLVDEALRMALLSRRPGAGLMHHSDRGVQYACRQHRQLLERAGMIRSMSRAGNCYDNAVMESFFGKLKTELINEQTYQTHDQARSSIFEYLEGFYNRQRRHSSLGYLSPDEYERRDQVSANSPMT